MSAGHRRRGLVTLLCKHTLSEGACARAAVLLSAALCTHVACCRAGPLPSLAPNRIPQQRASNRVMVQRPKTVT
jgi:hypothetical protein